MENYNLIIESVIKKYRNEVNKIYPKANYPNEVENRKQYSMNNSEKMALEIKSLMIKEGINVEDLKIRQDVINSLSQFRDYCALRHTQNKF